MCLHAGSLSAEKVGQGEVGVVIHRVTCTWWLLGFALKEAWLGLDGPPLALTACTGLENTNLPCSGFVSGIFNVMSLLINAGSELGFRFGVTAWTEMKIWCVKGMLMLNVVSS